jgi:hypothetical protein
MSDSRQTRATVAPPPLGYHFGSRIRGAAPGVVLRSVVDDNHALYQVTWNVADDSGYRRFFVERRYDQCHLRWISAVHRRIPTTSEG